MTQEFLKETADFELEELYSLQSIQSFFQGLPAVKAIRMINLVEEISHKFQLEIVHP